jgi:hypothetical protein
VALAVPGDPVVPAVLAVPANLVALVVRVNLVA